MSISLGGLSVLLAVLPMLLSSVLLADPQLSKRMGPGCVLFTSASLSPRTARSGAWGSL